eukprot:scaffold131998_cov26-Prasinocladus_malaysianus.AAC.2
MIGFEASVPEFFQNISVRLVDHNGLRAFRLRLALSQEMTLRRKSGAMCPGLKLNSFADMVYMCSLEATPWGCDSPSAARSRQ